MTRLLPSPPRGSPGTQAVDRALSILELVADGPRSVTELATALGVHDSTAFRLLRALQGRRLVHRELDGWYRLGPGLFGLAQRALDNLEVRDVARVRLAQLRDTTGYTVHLARLEDCEVVYIDKFESPRVVRMYSRIGKVAPLHCTGVAKAIVAFLPERERATVAAQIDFHRYTATTIDALARYLDELRETRSRGYAIDAGEHEASIVCIAAPLFEADGRVRQSISLSTPSSEADLEELLGSVPLLLAASREISEDLGWAGPNDVSERQPAAARPIPRARE